VTAALRCAQRHFIALQCRLIWLVYVNAAVPRRAEFKPELLAEPTRTTELRPCADGAGGPSCVKRTLDGSAGEACALRQVVDAEHQTAIAVHLSGNEGSQ
jgi:hypothetical protein